MYLKNIELLLNAQIPQNCSNWRCYYGLTGLKINGGTSDNVLPKMKIVLPNANHAGHSVKVNIRPDYAFSNYLMRMFCQTCLIEEQKFRIYYICRIFSHNRNYLILC